MIKAISQWACIESVLIQIKDQAAAGFFLNFLNKLSIVLI